MVLWPSPGPRFRASSLPGSMPADVGSRTCRIAEAGEWARHPGHVVWIGLYQPSIELLVAVQEQFGLHRLAIEDARHAHQRPKVERYGDCIFVVVRTAQLVDGRIALGETQIFMGQGFVVTVRRRLGVLRARPGEDRILSEAAGPRRGLYPPCGPRLHREPDLGAAEGRHRSVAVRVTRWPTATSERHRSEPVTKPATPLRPHSGSNSARENEELRRSACGQQLMCTANGCVGSCRCFMVPSF